MNAWLYQMALRKEWSPEDYRVKVWENQEVTWPSGKVTGAEADKVIPGDVFFLFFAETRNVSPGIYGVGIIIRYSLLRREITFRVCPPSDHLKTDPLWNNNVKQAIGHIRGGFSQGTMWRIPPADLELIQSSVRQRMTSS
jgi:hypothetical protein